MHCDYFDAAVCRSCALMGMPYRQQVARKEAAARDTLRTTVPTSAWLSPGTSAESGFRNKAKLVVGGRPGAVTAGILDGSGHGVDLRDCGLYEPGLSATFDAVTAFVDDLGLVPYDVPRRRGELKYLLLTHSPDGELMLRFVLRSTRHVEDIHAALPRLLGELPMVRVASINLHPEHKATLEGDEELWLTAEQALPMRIGDITLYLRPNSFFQTNSAVAAALYAQASEWVLESRPERLWDLYCGVGGFALHAAVTAHGVGLESHFVGVEVSDEAVRSARRSAEELVATGRVSAASIPTFVTGDASGAPVRIGPAPALVIVNPPRRGIGSELAAWLDASPVSTVIYSSCNARSLAADLQNLPGFVVDRARLFDMFPQTEHSEVLVRLRRRD